MNNRYFKIGEVAFVVIGILFFAGALSEFISDSISSLIRYALWFGCTLLLCLRWQATWAIARRAPLVWIVIALSIISIGWSDNPSYSKLVVREVMQMATFGLYFASRFKLLDQLYLLAFTLGGIGIASALLAVGVPAIGVDHKVFVGAWIGVYTHKNTLGKFMSLSVVAFSVLVAGQQLNTKRILRFLTLGGLCLSFALVILTTSQTSLSVSVLSISFLYIYRLYQQQGNKRQLYLELAIFLVILLVYSISTSWEAILTSMGREITLTGRTEIWGSSLAELSRRPWLGFGRGTFWAPDSRLARIAGAVVGHKYIPPHAHNGYIDLALEIGYVGLFFFLSSFLVTYKRAITRSFVSKTAKDIWPLAFLSWLAVYNLTESMLMYKANIYWPLFMSIALCAKPSGRTIYLHVRNAQPKMLSG